MDWKTFIFQLAKTTFLVTILLYGLHLFPVLKDYQRLSWSSCVFFVILSVFTYAIGAKAAVSPNKNAFTAVIMGFLFFKMMLSIAFLVIYHQQYPPDSKWFLAPFFIVYLCYTIFETHFMIKLGKLPTKKRIPDR